MIHINNKTETKMKEIVSDFKNDFRNQYSYIYFEDFVNDETVEDFISKNIDNTKYNMMLDLFKDYVLSQGLCDVQE